MYLTRAFESISIKLIVTKNRYYFFLLVSILAVQGCRGVRHLKENESMLYKQHVETPKGISSSALSDLYVQEANKKFLGLPVHTLVTLYYLGKASFKPEKIEKKITTTEAKFKDKIANAKNEKKEEKLQYRMQQKVANLRDKLENGNLLMKWGEPVSVYDSAKIEQTVERISDYLFNKGFFNNRVFATTTDLTSKLKVVRYRIQEGKPYILDTILYFVPDSGIYQILTRNKTRSLIKINERYDQINFSNERERIDLLLKENGYYDFSRQYVVFDIDTAFHGNQRVAAKIIINNPAKRGYHKKFVVDEVHFMTDAGITLPGVSRQQEIYRNTLFEYYDRTYSPKILSQRTFIRPGENYSRNRTFNTQRQLANLDVFKFVNINYDTSDGKFIANVYTSAMDRYQWTNEVGVSVTQGFPGPFYNLNFKKRNLFRGLENFEMNGRIGYEGVASATETNNVYQSVDASINASIVFPQFILPLKEETQYKLGRINPRTRALVGYSYTNRPEYIRSATTFNYIYSWENRRIRRFNFTFANLSIIDSKLDSAYNQLLQNLFIEQGNTLYLTFEPSFVSSMIFNMVWNPRNYGNLEQTSEFIRWTFESGGTLQNFFQYPIADRQDLQSFRYLRFNGDVYRHQVIDKFTSIAYRFNLGIGYSYDGSNVLPYEKYFFAGGSNSVRAWRPRRLGPGSWRPETSVNPEEDGLYDYKYEQPGEILLEGSIELRRKLFGFIEGAAFVDYGNVWSFQLRIKRDAEGNEIENGNAQFKLNQFYKEFGVGTGFGVRFNFTFLVIRFDVGMKVYDPARVEGERFVLDDIKFFKPFGTGREPVIYNLGVGFPF
jgi:outer membrane protein assembly factor BamA